MALVFDREDFRTVALSLAQLGIARLELQVELGARGLVGVVGELDSHVNSPTADIEPPADLARQRHGGDDLAHQRAFLALVAQLDGGLLLQVAHPLLYLRAGETLLNLIPEQHPLLAAHADDARRLLLALAELEPTPRVGLRWPPLQPVIEPLHRHLAIANRRAALRADIMPQPLHIPGGLQQMPVDVFAEDDLLLHRHRRIEIHLQFAHARRAPGQFHAKLLPGVRSEIGGVAPELILLERLGVMQSHHQRGINLVQKSRVTCIARKLMPFAQKQVSFNEFQNWVACEVPERHSSICLEQLSHQITGWRWNGSAHCWPTAKMKAKDFLALQIQDA